MKNRRNFILSFVFFSLLFIQKQTISQPERNIEFFAGSRWRATPIYLGKLESFGPVNGHVMQQDAHISGLALFTGIEYPVGAKMAIGYQLFGRHDEFLTEIPPTNTGIKEPISRFFFDHSLFANYQWKSGGKLNIRNGLGFSINNLNSAYSFWRNDGSDSVFVQENFMFPTFDLPMDFQLNRFQLTFTPSFSLKNPFPILQSQFLLLNLSARYNFIAKSRKS